MFDKTVQQKVHNLPDNVISKLNDMESRIATVNTDIVAGKTKVADAITEKGVEASVNDTFQVLSEKIGLIETGGKGYEFIISINIQTDEPTEKKVGDIWIETDKTLNPYFCFGQPSDPQENDLWIDIANTIGDITLSANLHESLNCNFKLNYSFNLATGSFDYNIDRTLFVEALENDFSKILIRFGLSKIYNGKKWEKITGRWWDGTRWRAFVDERTEFFYGTKTTNNYSKKIEKLNLLNGSSIISTSLGSFFHSYKSLCILPNNDIFLFGSSAESGNAAKLLCKTINPDTLEVISSYTLATTGTSCYYLCAAYHPDGSFIVKNYSTIEKWIFDGTDFEIIASVKGSTTNYVNTDITIGRDGYIYSRLGTALRIYDPNLNLLNTTSVSATNDMFSVDEDNNMYMGELSSSKVKMKKFIFNPSDNTLTTSNVVATLSGLSSPSRCSATYLIHPVSLEPMFFVRTSTTGSTSCNAYYFAYDGTLISKHTSFSASSTNYVQRLVIHNNATVVSVMSERDSASDDYYYSVYDHFDGTYKTNNTSYTTSVVYPIAVVASANVINLFKENYGL